MKTTIAVAALTLLFCSAASAGELCPEPPHGMEYGDSIVGFAEAAIKGKPYADCAVSDDGNLLGEGYTYTKWFCDTFNVTKKAVTLPSRSEDKLNEIKYNMSPRYHEQWTVTDKNGAHWSIYHESFSGTKPVSTRTSAALANGCKATVTYYITAPGIDIVLRDSWIQPLKKKPVPTF